ncbi:MAG TPA: transcriptional regulator [Myxococcales bacterium]|nr:transcriptional regulator [Myxococcales bacterium]HAN32830.1 transcriptional regulator [Myxococcales bacterium]|tara:strand:+ start:593 stop:1210 length:618 start_codon:yes stop_codon:yes gene_type:complete
MRAQTQQLRRDCRNHPFVRGIEDGSLPAEVFCRWVVQDWRYLLTYVQVLESLAELAPLPGPAQRWRSLAEFTRSDELALHRAYAVRFGLTDGDLDGATDAPATRAYTQFLCDQAERSYGFGVAALVPCGVGYVTLAADLSKGALPPEPRYADWIVTYADPDFAQAVQWMERQLDELDEDDEELLMIYRKGAEHELAFWQQLWAGW